MVMSNSYNGDLFDVNLLDFWKDLNGSIGEIIHDRRGNLLWKKPPPNLEEFFYPNLIKKF